MGSWAKDQAAEIKSGAQRNAKDRTERVQLNAIIKDDSKRFFDRIGQHIERHVKEFNEELEQSTALRCSHDENTISIDKESFPRVSMTLTLLTAPVEVILHQVKRLSVFSTEEEHADGALRFGIDRDGQICLAGKEPDAVAREVLHPFIDAFKTEI